MNVGDQFQSRSFEVEKENNMKYGVEKVYFFSSALLIWALLTYLLSYLLMCSYAEQCMLLCGTFCCLHTVAPFNRHLTRLHASAQITLILVAGAV